MAPFFLPGPCGGAVPDAGSGSHVKEVLACGAGLRPRTDTSPHSTTLHGHPFPILSRPVPPGHSRAPGLTEGWDPGCC